MRMQGKNVENMFKNSSVDNLPSMWDHTVNRIVQEQKFETWNVMQDQDRRVWIEKYFEE